MNIARVWDCWLLESPGGKPSWGAWCSYVFLVTVYLWNWTICRIHTVKPPEDILGTPAPVGNRASHRSYAFHLLCVFFVFKVPDNFRDQWKHRNQLIQYHHLNKKQGIKTVSMVSQNHKILKYLQHHSNKVRPKQNESYAILNTWSSLLLSWSFLTAVHQHQDLIKDV